MVYKAELYRHELDDIAFSELKSLPDFEKIREKFINDFDENAAKIEFLSNGVRLSENQLPEIYQYLPPICEKLGIDIPDLYYVNADVMNAGTGGINSPFIFITSKLVETLPAELIPTVLAHECGHIACQHFLYHSMATLLDDDCGVQLKKKGVSLKHALLFWDRCSEFSADRASVLCDGTAEKMVEVLLRLHGYENVNHEEFLKQASDLKTLVNDLSSNRFLEEMLTKDESHPRLATRAYECNEWTKTSQYHDILNGTYTLQQKKNEQLETKEVISGEINIETNSNDNNTKLEMLNKALNEVNGELERYSVNADTSDYLLAVASGILSGAVDALFVGKIEITENDIAVSHEQVNKFIHQFADMKGIHKERLKDVIAELEKKFPVAQDAIWKGAGIGVSAKNHHLADLAHHPTPLGLICSLLVQFLRIGVFVNSEGEWHVRFVKTTQKDIINILIPAILTGILNWLVHMDIKQCEEEFAEIPDSIKKLAHLVVSVPILIEVAKCADNWFGHLVSDMGGSKNTPGTGMGIPGIFISLLYELSSLPGLKNTGLPKYLNDLYVKDKADLRHEIPVYKAAMKQTVPVVINEVMVRTVYFVRNLIRELQKNNNEAGAINWKTVIPFGSRTVDRMLTVSTMTFTVADTADAAVRAAIESGGNSVLMAGNFVTRFNYIGAGRAAFAIVKDISGERKEAQLIHEKMLLSEAKAEIFMDDFIQFKIKLEETVAQYLAEDIEQFVTGFDYMNEGLASGDSNLVIKGNVVIQRVLGREPQFENQEEFDALMDSDIPLVL